MAVHISKRRKYSQKTHVRASLREAIKKDGRISVFPYILMIFGLSVVNVVNPNPILAIDVTIKIKSNHDFMVINVVVAELCR